MIVFCEECGTRYNVDLNNMKGQWHSYHCRECGLMITISKEKPTDIISPDVALKNRIDPAEASDPDRKKRILVVDDSKLFRKVIKEMLESDGTLEVVGEAADGTEALQLNKELKPDLITLDVNMPGMGGTSVLKHFMLTNPCPVVIVSNLSSHSQDTIIDFLRLGAVDFLMKPNNDQDQEEVRKIFVKTVHEAAEAKVEEFTRLNTPQTISTQSKPAGHRIPCRQLAIIASGAGGIAELFTIFNRLPSGFDGTVIIVQNMPEDLVSPLVSYMNQICRIPVLPISQETPIVAGHCYIGTSNTVWKLQELREELYLRASEEPAVSSTNPPNIDALLQSVADRFPGVFSLVLLSGAKTCSLETIRYFKERSGKVIIKQPSTCMIRGHLEEIRDVGLADAEAVPGNTVSTIIDHLRLQCMALPGGILKKIAPEFFQKRRHQRIYFTLQTGPQITLGVAGTHDNNTIFQAGIMDLSEAGVGFVVKKGNPSPLVLDTGDKVRILSVDGEPQLQLLKGVTVEVRWVMDTAEIPFIGHGGMFLDLTDPLRQDLRHIVDSALAAHQNALFCAKCT